MTPLTPAHRAWRTKVFIATWLNYVGFYFCRRPFSAAKSAIGEQNGWSPTTLGNIYAAYLIAYALGQFLASRMGPRLGPRKNVLLGMAVSIGVTVAMGVTLSPWVMAGLIAVNGLAQATGWSGNVGTMAAWFHKHERGKVMGAWSTNFTVGAITAGLVMGLVLGDGSPSEQPWRWCFFTGAIVLGVVWIQFHILQRDRPEAVGLAAVDDPVTAVDESKEPDEPEPPAPAITPEKVVLASLLPTVSVWEPISTLPAPANEPIVSSSLSSPAKGGEGSTSDSVAPAAAVTAEASGIHFTTVIVRFPLHPG